MSGEAHSYVIAARETGLLRLQRRLRRMLGAPVRALLPGQKPHPGETFLGWGRKPSGLHAQALARRHGNGFLLLEDGFLRSFDLGVNGAPPLSVVADGAGIYYDATGPSDLENMLNTAQFTPEELAQAEKVIEVLRREGLSKYNSGLPVPEGAFPEGERRVLVVDQTAKDASIRLGLANEGDFAQMLWDAADENPDATIYVKAHPDVLAGKRRGCLAGGQDTKDVKYITENWHPHDLLRHFDKVYVVTSQMGLDALILGKEVHCFGMPFYAGWGLTHDRKQCNRRQAQRSLTELMAAAYLRYARYIDPVSGRQTDFFTVARHIARQKQMHRFWTGLGNKPWSGRVFAFGFQFWKPAMARPFFGEATHVRFVRSVRQARRAGISAADRIAVWGWREPSGLQDLAEELQVPIVRVEDGFLRSVGLGSDFVPPMSLIFDSRGIYFDPSTPSDLEHMLQTARFTDEQLEEARKLRAYIVKHGLTKYNLPRHPLPEEVLRAAAGRKVVLVPGQVENDASIIRGTGKVRTNLALLQAARAEEPDAFIIYKPHPDVLAHNRTGRLHLHRALHYCDHVETRADIISCIEAANTVHTMTSLSGFDALLRGKRVVCHGMPFYAGWGLTEDRSPPQRRARQRSLDELLAAALLLYPRYVLNGQITDTLAIARHLQQQRKNSGLASLPLQKGGRYGRLLRETLRSLQVRLSPR